MQERFCEQKLKHAKKTIKDLKADIDRRIDEEFAQTQANLKDTQEWLEKKIKITKEKKELEKENEILRQYYDLGKEPSDEIKTKIHIDLEINRLKEEKDDLKNEILRLTAICRPPVYVPQHYPYYGFGYRQF